MQTAQPFDCAQGRPFGRQAGTLANCATFGRQAGQATTFRRDFDKLNPRLNARLTTSIPGHAARREAEKSVT